MWRLKVPQVVSQGAQVRGTLRHFFWKYVLLKNARLRISENSYLLLKYTPLDAVSISVVKMFYFEN